MKARGTSSGLPDPAREVLMDTLNDIEREVLEEQRPSGNKCRTCMWMETLTPEELAVWDAIFWDGEKDGLLIQNKAWQTQAIQRVILKKQPKGQNFPASSVENHRKAVAVQGVQDAIKKAKKAKLRPDAAAELDKAAREFTLSSPKESTIKLMKSRMSELQKDEHEIGDIPQKMVDRAIDVLTNAKRDRLQDFTADELNTIADAVTNLIHQDKLKKELLSTQKFRSAEEAKKQATTAVTTRWGSKREVATGARDDAAERRKLTRVWNGIKRISTWDQLNIRTKAQILGGRGSVAETLLADNLQKGDGRVAEISMDSVAYMQSIYKKNGLTDDTLKTWSQALGGKLVRSPVKPVKVKLPESRGEDGARVATLHRGSETSNLYRCVEGLVRGLRGVTIAQGLR